MEVSPFFCFFASRNIIALNKNQQTITNPIINFLTDLTFMKKIFTLALSAMFMLGGVSSFAQTEYTILQDLTSTLQNSDFSADQPVGVTISTYDYNMTDVEVGTSDITKGLFGQQAVTGWTAANPSDNVRVMESSSSTAREDGANARAAGIFAYVDDAVTTSEIGLGGAYYAPYIEAGVAEGQALGMVAVWGADLKYTQDVTLPAGAYMMLAKVYNAAGSGTLTNNIGFIASDGTAYTSSKETYPVGEWVTDTIIIRLSAETAGQVTVGFKFGSGSGSAPHLFLDNVKLYSIDEKQLIQKEIDAAKEELNTLIEIGKVYNVDTSASQQVYNNANATLEQVQAAIEKQREINASGVTDLSDFFFKNSHFTADEPVEGGICTYDYDCEKNNIATTNYSMLPLSGWTRSKTDNGCASGVYAIGSDAFLGGAQFLPPTEMKDGSTEGKVLGFVTCWSMQMQYTQPATLPAGQYTLTMSYYNTGGTTAIAKNLIGFIADDGTEYLAESLTFPVGKWTTDEVTFTLAEETTGKFSLGYAAVNTGSANMPHFFTDGISLVYVGTGINPSQLALKSAISTGETALAEPFNADLKENLQEAVDAAQKLLDDNSEDADANKAAADAINDMIDEVNENIAAYVLLQEFYDEGGALSVALEIYDDVSGMSEKLGELSDEVSEALDIYNWTTEEIEEAIASLSTIIKEGVQAAFDEAVASGTPLDEPLDISILFETLGATYSTSALSNTSVVDKQWNYGNATNFKTQYGTMEVWSQSPFEVSQTLSDMPAGTYTITTKAFYRTAANSTNYGNYQEDKTDYAFIFAGQQKTGLANVSAIALDLSDGETAIPSGWSEIADYSVAVPNNQQSAYNVFESDEYTEVVEKSVKTSLGTKGDLTFGISGDQMESDSWVVWYTFSIAYDPAVEKDLVKENLTAAIEAFNTYLEENVDNMNGNAQTAAEKVISEAEAAQNGDAAAMSAAIVALQEAQAAAEENVAAMTTLNNSITALDEAVEAYAETASESALAEYDAIQAEFSSDNTDGLTNEEIIALAAKADAVAAALRIPEYAGASDENPVDMTQVIVNNSFEGDGEGSLNGWTYYNGSDTKAADNSNATYTIENADGNYVFNTWNGSAPEGGFYVSQVLKSLPAGTYALSVLIASDLNNKISVSANDGTEEFEIATTGDPDKDDVRKTIGDDVTTIFNLTETGDVEIKVSSNTWFKADNFRLTYYGTESSKEPTKIEDINVASAKTGVIYNLSGQIVDENYKGIVIKNGKKVLVK